MRPAALRLKSRLSVISTSQPPPWPGASRSSNVEPAASAFESMTVAFTVPGSDQEVSFFGVHYIIPLVERWPGTVIAVNVGGAVIPTLLSLYNVAF